MFVEGRDPRAVAHEVWTLGHEFDLNERDRLKRHRQLDPDSADLLWILTLASRPKRILEIGTGSGISTIHLADAARRIGSVLTTVDNVVHPQVVQNLASAGVTSVVDRIVQDAGAYLRTCRRAVVDFMFLDAERSEYLSYLPDLVEVLAAGATLLVDNLLRPAPDEIAPFISAVSEQPNMAGVAVDAGHGLQIFVKAMGVA